MFGGPFHRNAFTTAIGVCVAITIWLNLDRLQRTSLGSRLDPTAGFHTTPTTTHGGDDHLPSPVVEYFNQVFSPEKPASYDFPALRQHCDRTEWTPEREDVYLQCGGMFAGMTSIMSEVKTCLKMAVEAGTGIILPAMPLRDSTNLKEFNIENDQAYMPYDQWFDAKHLIEGLGRACPRMKVLHPDQLNPDKGGKVTVKNQWEIDIMDAPGYRQYTSHFWTGNPFKIFFDEQLTKLQKQSTPGKGISVIKINAIFLLFRITDDPTGNDLKLWNDLSLLIRFLDKPRKIVNQLLGQMNRPFYGVHFRVENDTIWGSLESQLTLDLDALDKAWSMYGKGHASGISSEKKPLVYLACGDEEQMKKFVEAGKARGWEVTHKWGLARQSSSPETVQLIDELAFDFQGAVDMGMMIQSHFFIGISGSAFSSTVANARDVTGRYRWSSLGGLDDGGARSHLVTDGVASSYPCCL